MSEFIKSWVGTLVLFFCIIIFVLAIGWYFHLSMQVVEGYSMFPTLMEGDITITQFTNPNLIEVGDIVVFYSPFKEERIVHRVIEKVVRDDKIYFRTQGDNSHRPDPYKIPGNRIIGKVIFVIPRVGLIRLYISPSTGILLIILFVVLSLLYDYVEWRRRRLRSGHSL